MTTPIMPTDFILDRAEAGGFQLIINHPAGQILVTVTSNSNHGYSGSIWQKQDKDTVAGLEWHGDADLKQVHVHEHRTAFKDL